MRSTALTRLLSLRALATACVLVALAGTGAAASAATSDTVRADAAVTRRAVHHRKVRVLSCRAIRVWRAHHRRLPNRRTRAKAVRCRRAAQRRAARRHRLALQRKQAQQQQAVPAPTQAVSSSTRGSAAGWNGFGVGAWPSAAWRPYAPSSPFNQVVDGTAVHPDSAAIVQRVLSWNAQNPVGNMLAGTADTSQDYAHPTFYAQPSDPVFTLHATGGSPSIEGLRIPVPDAARPAGGSDHHMAIVTPDGWEYDLWNVISKPQGGGTLTFELGGRTRIDGDGLNSYGTAARFGNLAGVIRAQELVAGHIDHALFVTVKCTSAGTSFGYGTHPAPEGGQSAFVYPASHGGSSCSSADNAGAPPMGARFELAMSDAQIQALAVPAWKKTILTALARYGGYVGDTGGPGFAFQFESGTTYTSFGVTDPLVTFARSTGLSPYNGVYAYNMAEGVDWARYLRVLVPPAAA